LERFKKLPQGQEVFKPVPTGAVVKQAARRMSAEALSPLPSSLLLFSTFKPRKLATWVATATAHHLGEIGDSIGETREYRPAMANPSTENEVLAQELEHIGHKVETLEGRVKDVEEVIPRLERAAQTTARAMEEISEHWDAVYRAMRRAE